MNLSQPIKQMTITRLHLIIITSLFMLVCLTIGSYLWLTQLPIPHESDISLLAPHNNLQVQVRILTPPITQNSRTRFLAEVNSIKDQLGTGKIQVQFRGMINSRRGDEVTIIGDLQRTRLNDTYLKQRQVFSQLFATSIKKGDTIIYQVTR